MRQPTRAQLHNRIVELESALNRALEERDFQRERATLLSRSLEVYEKNMDAFSQANATMADGLSHVLNRAFDLHKLKGER